MEMIPDQKPPAAGWSLKAKVIVWSGIAVLLLGFGLYLKYPPLKAIGYVRVPDGVEVSIYRGALVWNGEVYENQIFVDMPEGAEMRMILAFAQEVCELARKTRGVFDTRNRLPPKGQITVRFVDGGRYLYRFNATQDWEMSYDTTGCDPAFNAAPLVPNWSLARLVRNEFDGGVNLRIGLRWSGAGTRVTEGFPYQDVCEQLLRRPPPNFERAIDDARIISIVLERGFSLFGVELYSWSGVQFRRINNLCIKIGPVKEA